MKNIIAVESIEKFLEYQSLTKELDNPINNYIQILQKFYQLNELPKGVLWTTSEIATNVLSNNIVAGYTNEQYITMTPETDYWRHYYYSLMKDCKSENIKKYYNKFSEKFVLQVIGHEIAHNLDLFYEEWTDSTTIWFEEGMVEFLSCYYLLSEEEYKIKLNAELDALNYYSKIFGEVNLEEFKMSSYKNLNKIQIFMLYWKSFIIINEIFTSNNKDILKVFKKYHEWYQSNQRKTKSEWFNVK